MSNAISVYASRLAQLKKELSDIQIDLRQNKKQFNENQQKVYDFVTGKKSLIQFNIEHKQYFIKIGDESKGFMHILLKHYGGECKEGKLTARNILNIATTIKLGSPYTSKKNGYISISNEFDKIRYIIILNQDTNGCWVVSYYSVDEDNVENEEVGRGDCS